MEKIGKYQILDQIGKGGMGVVYKALDPLIERVVAIKMISADLDSEPGLRGRFFREARSAGHLSHKNIITIYELSEESGTAYLAMEFLEGEDLKAKILGSEPLALERKIEIMREVCEGLAHAHDRSVIHRDIKPSNIFITASGQVKILDFGLARLLSSSDVTRSGPLFGTPTYMSPEQLRGERVDHRSDLFSAGVVFYELLTSRRPFSGDSFPTILYKILQEEPEPVENIDSGIPAELSAIVKRALAKDPAMRYQHAREMLRDLESSRQLHISPAGGREITGQELHSGVAPAVAGERKSFTTESPFVIQHGTHSSTRLYVYLALIVILVAGAGVGLWWALGPANETSHESKSTPPAPPASPPHVEPPRPAPKEESPPALTAARKLLDSQNFAEATREAQAVLDRAPGNAEAQKILLRARESMDKIALGNRQAHDLYAAGKYEEAMAALGGVLKIAPSDPQARELLTRLDRHARKSAGDALEQLKSDRSTAEEAGARDLAATVFASAKSAEAEGMKLYNLNQFGRATAKLFEAGGLYRRAESEARIEAQVRAARKSDQDKERAELRSHAENARKTYERARVKATDGGAESKAPLLFRDAARLASEAQAKWEKNDFAGARRDFEAASETLDRALEAAAKTTQSSQTEMESARLEMETAKRAVPGGDPRAAGEESKAQDLVRQGKLADAAVAYRHAASFYQAAAQASQKVEADRQAVLSVLERYKAALETKDMVALKNLWPALGGAQERGIREDFRNARSIQVSFRSVTVQLAGETATVACRRHYQVETTDGHRLQTDTRTTLSLRKEGVSWLIESVRFERD